MCCFRICQLVMFVLFPAIGFTEEKVCLHGACFERQVEVDGQSLSLRGIALFEYWLFDVYTGAFYAPKGVDTIEEALSEVPKYLVLHYHRSLERENFIENSEFMLDKNPNVSEKALEKQLKKLYSAYRSVGKGDRYSLSYTVERGTSLFLNSKEQIRIPGREFQKAYFGIWLSKYSVDSEFTKGLLQSDL